MRHRLLLVILFCSLQSMFSQVFTVTPIHQSGADENRVNIVMLSDGYQEHELPDFIADVTAIKDALFLESPYQEYQNYFNIYAIEVPSNESGASHPGTATDVVEPSHPVSVIDNYFDSTFDFFDIHRLIYATNSSAVYTVLADNFPSYDVAIVLVNSPYYGGSGGDYITMTTHTSANDLVLHEMGHTFSNLRDEYYAGDIFAQESINMTQETDPTLVRWNDWIGDNGVGVYQHSGSGNANLWYRPHQNCKMRQLHFSFCSVCKEGKIEQIHTMVSAIDVYSPENTEVVDLEEETTFSITTVDPIPNTLSVSWFFNGEVLATDVNEVILDIDAINSGLNHLFVLVEDETSLVRGDNSTNSHINVVSWSINKETLSIQASDVDQFQLEVFPNPTQDLLNVNLENLEIGGFDFELFTSGGVLVLNESTLESKLSLDITSLSAGTYLMKITLASGIEISKKVIKN